MSEHDHDRNADEIDERLARLARATADVRPRADFGARVVRAAAATKPDDGFWPQIPRAARFFVPAAAIMAAVALGIAVGNADDVDDEIAATFDQAEVEW